MILKFPTSQEIPSIANYLISLASLAFSSLNYTSISGLKSFYLFEFKRNSCRALNCINYISCGATYWTNPYIVHFCSGNIHYIGGVTSQWSPTVLKKSLRASFGGWGVRCLWPVASELCLWQCISVTDLRHLSPSMYHILRISKNKMLTVLEIIEYLDKENILSNKTISTSPWRKNKLKWKENNIISTHNNWLLINMEFLKQLSKDNCFWTNRSNK